MKVILPKALHKYAIYFSIDPQLNFEYLIQ